MVTLAKYRFESDATIPRPTNTEPIVILLNAVDRSELQKGPENGEYDTSRSFVSIIYNPSKNTYVYSVQIAEKQNDSEATYAYNVSRQEEHIDFNKTSKEVYDRIRGLNSWPGSYAILDDKNVKLWSSKIANNHYKEIPGTIVKIDKNGIEVVTKDTCVLITELQLPGKKKVLVKDFINGIKKEDYIGKIFK